MKTKGMTLLEVILAMTLLGILALSSSTVLTAFQRNFTRENKSLGGREDVRIAFDKFEQVVSRIAANRSLKLSWNIPLTNTADFYQSTILMKDLVNTTMGKIEVFYNRSGSLGTALIKVTDYTPILPNPPIVEELFFNGLSFKPYAILKDYGLPLGVDLADKTKRDNCVSPTGTTNPLGFSGCVDMAVSCKSPLVPAPPAGTVDYAKPGCIQNNAFPFIEISPDGTILYLSLKGTRKFQGELRETEGMTKAVFLETAGS